MNKILKDSQENQTIDVYILSMPKENNKDSIILKNKTIRAIWAND